MNLQEAIYQQYGVRVPLGIADGRHLSFKIDRLRNGFVLRLGICACFGSIIDGESIIFDGERYWQRKVEHNESPKIRFEWIIWEGARSAFERGERLSRADSERLALAVQRLEAWL